MKKKEEVIDKERWTAAGWDMLYLVQCGINSIVPDLERVAKMDLEIVYAKSRSQSLEALTYMALENLLESNPQIQIPDEKQILPKWKEAKNKAIAKNLMMDIAREELFAFLEERGIWHVALKGVVLCHMYPKYGMRQMADNDILFDPAFRQEIRDWFVEQGYEVESFEIRNHDEYLKKPVYNFEMHTSLFQESEQPELTKYYLTIKDRLIRKPEKQFEYYMTDEDFYLYMVAHAYKHYCYAGMGLRFLVDLYVYNNVKKNLDHSYLDKEMNQLGFFEFENEMRELVQKILSPEARVETLIDILSEKEQFVLKDVTSSGTYGTMEKLCSNELRKIQPNGDKISGNVKFQYLMHRLFPDKIHMEKWCRQRAPYFWRHRWLMPLAWIWRILRGGIKKKDQIREEVDAIKKA